MDLNFHQTFKPEKKYISELLQVADESIEVTLDELSNMTGIPQGKSSGKLVPHLKYASYMGLIEYKLNNSLYSLNLTSLGREILDQDMALSEDVTLLVLHGNLLKNSNSVQPWRFCFNEYFNKYGKKSKYAYFLREVENEYGDKIKFGPFIKTYEEMFSSLGLIDIQTEKLEQEDSMIFIGFECTRETLPAIGYVFYEYWEESFPKETEITSNQLGNLGFRNAFAWSELEELEILERMSDYGLIRLNKQLMPFTIIRLKEKKDIEKELYIELF